jgi:tetratricopeptide (TPR) repeat protein
MHVSIEGRTQGGAANRLKIGLWLTMALCARRRTTMRFRLLSKAIIVLAVAVAAVPCWGGGLDLIKKGQEAEKASKWNAALEAYRDAIKAGDLTAGQLSFVYYRRGSIHGFLGNNVNGIDDFSKSVELNPKQGAAYSLRGYLRGVVGQYDLAEKDQQTAMKLAKDQKWENYLPWVLQHYAELWRRRGQFDKALAYCERALQLSPYSVVYFRRAWIYLDMGRTAQAKADFDKFEQEMKREQISYNTFWPDERGAISRLSELR